MSEQYEEILKGLDRAGQVAYRAAHGVEELDDKVRMHRLKNTIERCRGDLLKLIFEFDDAEAFASKTTTCEECGAVIANAELSGAEAAAGGKHV